MENHTAPCKQSKVPSIWGGEYPSLTVLVFNLCRSIQNLSLPSFFLTSSTALAHGLKLLLIAPTSTISWEVSFHFLIQVGWYSPIPFLKGWGSVILMLCFRMLHLPKLKSFLENTSAESTKRSLAACCWSAVQALKSSKFSWSKTQDSSFPPLEPCLSCSLVEA